MNAKMLAAYGRSCGEVLARAHARTGDRIAIASYLGKGDQADRALVRYAAAYADQNDRDYKALREAVASSRLTAKYVSDNAWSKVDWLPIGRRSYRRSH